MPTTNLVDPARCGCRPGVPCRLCVREARRRKAAEPPAPKVQRRAIPCKFLGDVQAGCATCGEGGKTRGCDVFGSCTWMPKAGSKLPVCATCDDYVADPTLLPATAYYGPPDESPAFPPRGVGEAAFPRWRPTPPPAVRPTHDRLILTAVIGPHADAVHALTGPGQRRYAERVGAEYAVLRDATQDGRVPCAEKWRAKDWVPHYPGGTLWIDADVFVMPDAPDVFDAVPADRIGMVDVSNTDSILTWAPGEYEPLCRSQGVTPHPQANATYWNSGVWVGRPRHAAYWEPPPRPFPPAWCAEEHWCRHNLHTLGLTVHPLDRRFNWTWPQDRGFRSWADTRPWFVHLAGMGNKDVPGWVQSNKEWQVAIFRLLAALAN